MEFRALTDEQYQEFIDQYDRVYLTQLVEYGDVRSAGGARVDRVGLIDDGKVVGAATVVYEPWARLFRRAIVHFGPMLDYDNADLVRTFMTELKKWVMKNPRVIALRVNPYVIRRPYEDLEAGDATQRAQQLDQVMAEVGGVPVEGDYFDGVDIHPIYLYSKNLEGMTYDEAFASFKNNVRTDIRNAAANGVRVEYLGPDDLDVIKKLLDHTEERTEMPHVEDSAIDLVRNMMVQMGTERYVYPVAVLDTKEALESIGDELRVVEVEMAALRPDEEGGAPTKKQQKQLKELRFRYDALQRRRDKTLKVQQERGERVILTASLYVETPSDLIFHYSGGYDDLASFRGVYAVHEAMIKRAIERGKRWYNMNVIRGVFEEGEPGFGLLDYKRHFQGTVEELVGTYEFPLRPFLAKKLGATR
ncbi:MAG: peptidoglycan bridge formation glycyltransferase FemA/FemB family protein [Scrofimicrobium sp.]